MKNFESIGEAIKNCRKEKGLTQPQLAALVGVTHAAISYWENDINVPSVKVCWSIADTLGVTIDELVGRV